VHLRPSSSSQGVDNGSGRRDPATTHPLDAWAQQLAATTRLAEAAMTVDPTTTTTSSSSSSNSSRGPTWRSRRTPGPGAFLVMDKAKQAARAAGKPVLDLSIGTSDLAPPPEALVTLKVSHDKTQGGSLPV
jgi:hypothetical protein